jgi:NADH-quinone oxidoreductase subunit G
VNEDLTELGLSKEALAKIQLIYVGTHANPTSEVAQVVLPSLAVFEKDGSFINQNFRLQRFKAAVPGPRGVQPDFMVLEKIAAPLAEEKPVPVTIDAVWERMAAHIPQFEDGLRWRTLPAEGLALDASAFRELEFVETKNLKFDPAALKKAVAVPAEV